MTYRIIAAAIEVHRSMGPGLLESIYRACLTHELRLRGLAVETEHFIALSYKGMSMPDGFRADLLVEDQVLVELKAVDKLLPVHQAQLLSYMRLCNLDVGLLLNFHAPTIRQGLRRLLRKPIIPKR